MLNVSWRDRGYVRWVSDRIRAARRVHLFVLTASRVGIWMVQMEDVRTGRVHGS